MAAWSITVSVWCVALWCGLAGVVSPVRAAPIPSAPVEEVNGSLDPVQWKVSGSVKTGEVIMQLSIKFPKPAPPSTAPNTSSTDQQEASSVAVDCEDNVLR